MSLSRKLLIIGLMVFGVMLFCRGQASATVYQLPNPDDDNTSTGFPSDIAIVVSNRNDGLNNRLDAPSATVKLFVPAGDAGNIVIQNGAMCANDTTYKARDWRFQYGGYGEATRFRLYKTSVGSAPNGGTTEIKSTGLGTWYDSQMNCSTYSIPINTAGYTASTVPGHEGYVVLMLVVDGLYLGSGNLNGFRLTTSGLATTGATPTYYSYYAGSGNKFALLERDGVTNSPAERHDYTLRFAPNCNMSTLTRTVRLHWYDDDWGTTYQPSTGYTTRLYEYTYGGTQTNSFEIPVRAGEGQPGYRDISVRRDRRYVWKWFGVDERNGVQFQLPYDSFNYYQDCTRYNMYPTISRVGSGVVAPGGSFTMNLNVKNDGNENSGSLCGTEGTAGGCVFVHQSQSSAGMFDFPTLPTNYCAAPPASMPMTPIVTSSGTGGTAFCRNNMEPGWPVGDYYHWRFSYTPMSGGGANGTGTFRVNIRPTSPPGQVCFRAYVYRAHPVTPAVRLSTHLCVTIADADTPYTRAYGGDVTAGFQGPCVGWVQNSADGITNAGIVTANRGPSTYEGSGTQLAVYAAGVIEGYSSAFLRAERPKGLSFANVGVAGDVGYGGTFNNPPCPRDFFGERPNPLPAPSGAGPTYQLPTAFPDGDTSSDRNVDSFLMTGAATYGLNNTGTPATIPNGRHIVIYVNGNLRINDNIILNNSGWTSLNNIPSLTVVVKGNIYVQPNVTRLDGVYIAQPTSDVDEVNPTTGGYFYTCGSGANPPSVTAGLMSDTTGGCADNKLTINGSIIALGIKLYRAFGDLGAAINNEPASSANIAEVFQYSPEFWLQPCNSSSCSGGSFSSVTALPPVL